MRKIALHKLLNTPDQLPNQKEYILELQNNSYSAETIYNYNRDLSAFARFLGDQKNNGLEEEIPFENINKLTITFYKGWLKARHHVKKPRSVKKKSLLNENNQALEIAKVQEDLLLKSIQNESLDLQAKRVNQQLGGNYVKFNNPEELDPRSINRTLTSLRNYLRFLIEFDFPTPLPPDAIKLIRAKRKKPQIPDLPQLLELVESPTSFEKEERIALRNRALLETLMASGMRISELVSIKRSQLNEEGKLLIMGKGGKQRFIYLTPRAMLHIKNYLATRVDDYAALFIPYSGRSLKKSDPKISTNYLQMKIAYYRKMLGHVIPASAHTIRHGFATYLAENGANPAAIQILLGHESLQTTTRYVHASDKFAQETHKNYHPVDK